VSIVVKNVGFQYDRRDYDVAIAKIVAPRL
jgi:hypothetical protein